MVIPIVHITLPKWCIAFGNNLDQNLCCEYEEGNFIRKIPNDTHRSVSFAPRNILLGSISLDTNKCRRNDNSKSDERVEGCTGCHLLAAVAVEFQRVHNKVSVNCKWSGIISIHRTQDVVQ